MTGPATNPKKTLRKYEPIWIELKNKKLCRITILKNFHRTIIRAVQKEKYEDIGFKIECEAERVSYRLEIKAAGNILEFKLTKGGLANLGVGDL